MTQSLRLALAAATLAALSCPVQADVLTFDDLSGSAYFTADYNGFGIGNNDIDTTAWFHTDLTSAFYVPQSPSTFIFTDCTLSGPGGCDISTSDPALLFHDTQPISSVVPFTFSGAYFSGGGQVRYQLYSGDTLVFTSANSGDLDTTPTFVSSGYAGIVTSVVVVGWQGHFALDDFTYTLQPIPEPASYGLMAIGLLAVGVKIRRRRA